MNREELIECLGEVDDRYVREAAPGNCPAKGRRDWRVLAGAAAAAAVLVTAVSASVPALWGGPDPAPGASVDVDWVADAPGCIRWNAYTYVDRGNVVYEMPEGLEPLGEVSMVTPPHDILPEDAPDLASNFGDGYAYWFPGNDGLIVFRYREWDAGELGREEPILLMFREDPGWEYATASYPCWSGVSGMVDAAEVIVEGTVTGVEEDVELDRIPEGGRAAAGWDDEPSTARYNVYTVQVTAVHKGDVQAGGELRVRAGLFSDALTASSEGSYLLFLYDYRAEGSDAPFVLLNPLQGAYPIERRFLYVPVGDPCGLFCVPQIVNPPYTHYCYPMNSIRLRIERELQAGAP